MLPLIIINVNSALQHLTKFLYNGYRVKDNSCVNCVDQFFQSCRTNSDVCKMASWQVNQSENYEDEYFPMFQ